MAGDTKMLQIILDRVNEVRDRQDGLEKKMDEGFDKVHNRLDMIGSSVAYLEDDTPTREEHDKLDKRVVRLEKSTASA